MTCCYSSSFQQEMISYIGKQPICLVSIALCQLFHLFVIKERSMHICINGVNISEPKLCLDGTLDLLLLAVALLVFAE